MASTTYLNYIFLATTSSLASGWLFVHVRINISAFLRTPAFLPPFRELFPVLAEGGFSTLFANTPRADHSGKRVDRTVLLLGHRIVLPQISLPNPPGCFLLPLPPRFPHSDKCSLYFSTVTCPPPDAMHRGQMSLVWECLGQAGINVLTAKTN